MSRTTSMPRTVHPAAWWLWAIGMAVAVSVTTNPLLLAIGVGVTIVVVLARRGESPWARAFRLYLLLGGVIVGLRVVFHVLVGDSVGDTLLVTLPSPRLPDWAAGITLLGPVYLEGLLAAALEGARLAAMIACIGAANALANPKRLLKVLPSALHELGAATVVAITVAPQLADSVQRVVRARRLRGDPTRGLRAFRRVALPVLQDTLDRSLLLASAMDSRGYGRRGPSGARPVTVGLTLTGLLGAAIGSYGILDTTGPAVLGLPVLLVGLALAGLGLYAGGKTVRRTIYRPDPWRAPEWVTAGAGVAAATAMIITARTSPESLSLPLSPLAPPALPALATVGLLLGLLPAFATPEPPVERRRSPGRTPTEVSTP